MFGSDFSALPETESQKLDRHAIRKHYVRTKVRFISLHSKYFLQYGNMPHTARETRHKRHIRQPMRRTYRMCRGNMPPVF